MKRKVTARDLSYSTTATGFLCISAMVGGYLERRFYGGYSKRKATSLFLAELNRSKRKMT